jgi:uncharacterized protein GlcG (DUF336 family)
MASGPDGRRPRLKMLDLSRGSPYTLMALFTAHGGFRRRAEGSIRSQKTLAFTLGPALAFFFAAPATGPLNASGDAALTAADVDTVVRQAAAEAQRQGLKAFVAVTDPSGHVLALFRMDGAPSTSRVPGAGPGQGLQGLDLPADLVAITKAGSGAFLSSGGNAFSTRTASFIIQQHFPPGVEFAAGGPLFGVQFSSLPCTDFKSPPLPLGLAGDPGGLPLYKGGALVGGVGVEGDGRYGVDLDPTTLDDPDDAIGEETSALAGTRGFETPDLIRGDRILADGIRLPFLNVSMPASPAPPASGGQYVVDAIGLAPPAPRDAPPKNLVPVVLSNGVAGQADPRFPTRGGQFLSGADVAQVIAQGALQTTRTRAAIRQPLGSSARVSISVVDLDGGVLGFFQNQDAPNFGIDVSVQKARTANFFSGAGAADDLARAGLSAYLTDGLPLDGSVAFSSRAVGFLAQPFFPPGIDGTLSGAFSKSLPQWSPFNTGLQLDLVSPTLGAILGSHQIRSPCTPAIPRLPNAITIFPGGVPLFKNGQLAGAIGISGDGVDQDDLIASAGSAGFEAPAAKRCDQLTIRGVRLPYVKFPRHPELP